jgi:hypothetical protein
MIKEQDVKAGAQFFYMTEYSEKPHLVTIISKSDIIEGVTIKFGNGNEREVPLKNLYHSYKEAEEANPSKNRRVSSRHLLPRLYR